MKVITIEEMWARYVERCVVEGMETDHEVALQRVGFAGGVAEAILAIASGSGIEFGREFVDEAFGAVRLEYDRRNSASPPTVDASKN